MKQWAAIAMMCASVLALASCDRKDGDWDSMVWKAEVPVVKAGKNLYMVSNRGETLTFACRNYSKPWIEVVMDGRTQVFPELIYQEEATNNSHHVATEWFTADMVGNKLTITFEPNQESWEHLLDLTVTAGDIFYIFKFRQYAH